MTLRVFSSLSEATGNFGPAALAIGNFDGVHSGHQALIKAMADYARAHSLKQGVMTFHPHPTVLVAPDRVPPMLCTLEERIARLEELGVECIMVLPFTHELSRFSPERFVTEALLMSLNTKATFVGDNFHFGHRQAGTPAVLSELGNRYDFATTFLKPIRYRGEVISSSAIRSALNDHKFLFASRLLGRWFSLTGAVVAGQGIGSRETVPTLNILPAAEQILLPGVSITKTFDLGSNRAWPSITNVGVRPTFHGEGVTIESFLLTPLTGPTPEAIRIEFRRFVREERAFASPELLKQQIFRDVSKARTYWRRVSL